MSKIILCIVCFFVFTSFVLSQEDTDSTNTVFKPNTDLNITISRFDNSELKIDGVLNELVWQNATCVGNFSETHPGDMVEPEVQTEAMMFYDDNNIYFAFICYDNDMSKLRATFADRDKVFNDDFAGFFLNTYSDDKQAYEILTNAYGIQGDLMWTPDGEDSNYDAVWKSDAKVYDDRWTCEFAIPFKSIRFPDKDTQEWNIHLYRVRPRESREQHFWVPIAQDDPSLFTKSAKLKGMKNIKGGKNFEVLPYMLGSRDYYLADDEDPNSDFLSDPFKGEIGLNLKYGITSNLTADVTINPDFSQVESDASVIDVNTSFALFYSEKRPFFLEGKSIFNTPTSVVYTRTINAPLFAAKLTGKVGDFDIGYMMGYDEKTPFIIPLKESSSFISSSRKSLSNIVRVKHSLKDDSYIGFIFTDREVKDTSNSFFKTDGYNRVFGIDGNYRFLDNYSFSFQLLGFNSKEVNDTTVYSGEESDYATFDNGKFTAAFDGESFTGFGGIATLRRSAKYWSFVAQYNNLSPVARRDNGFINSNDFRDFFLFNEYAFYLNNDVIERIVPELEFFVRHDYDGKLREVFMEPYLFIQFNNQINLVAGYYLINNEQYGGSYHRNVNRIWVNLNSNTLSFLRGGFFFAGGKYIGRFEEPSFVGYGFDFELWSTFKPIDRLVMENNYYYSQLAKSSYSGEKLYAGYLFRNKTTYQFSKNLFARLILEYNSFTNQFSIDPLISYKLNPFSIFYLGSTHQVSDLEDGHGHNRLVELERQIFLKFQYLWRL
ncbi:MAG: carbohydrate binding family 9 domain-containing protein [Ignavibacteria bacterium]|nr:carbohydrate binding family 9 domain-containing protein [Ignavibacteria bacterium]